MTESRRRVPVHNSESTTRISFQIRRERGAADNPNSFSVPVEPDRGLSGPFIGVVGQMGVQRSRQELGQLEDVAITGGDLLLYNSSY